MKKNRVLYLILIVVFFAISLLSNFLSKDEIVLQCSKIRSTEIVQKRLTKAYTRHIDVIRVELLDKVIHVQSNDQPLIRKTFKDIKKCQGDYIVEYFNKEKIEGIETFFIGSFFF